jgi:hypothetical protein
MLAVLVLALVFRARHADAQSVTTCSDNGQCKYGGVGGLYVCDHNNGACFCGNADSCTCDVNNGDCNCMNAKVCFCNNNNGDCCYQSQYSNTTVWANNNGSDKQTSSGQCHNGAIGAYIGSSFFLLCMCALCIFCCARNQARKSAQNPGFTRLPDPVVAPAVTVIQPSRVPPSTNPAYPGAAAAVTHVHVQPAQSTATQPWNSSYGGQIEGQPGGGYGGGMPGHPQPAPIGMIQSTTAQQYGQFAPLEPGAAPPPAYNPNLAGATS